MVLSLLAGDWSIVMLGIKLIIAKGLPKDILLEAQLIQKWFL